MEKELIERIEQLEKQVAHQKKDFWNKLEAITPILIPLAIAFTGWYFTNTHNTSELQIQQINNANQIEIAHINTNIGQSGLIKDFMPHLLSKDTSTRNIAMAAVLYAAPAPGKKIVEIIAKSGDSRARMSANDALDSKRLDLVNNLFAADKQIRLTAAAEISLNWQNDDPLLVKLIARAADCLDGKINTGDCANGMYNTVVVLRSFSQDLLRDHKGDFIALKDKVSKSDSKTKAQAESLINKIGK